MSEQSKAAIGAVSFEDGHDIDLPSSITGDFAARQR